MPTGLRRYQQTGDLHFITFSCHGRRPYLARPSMRDLFVDCLRATRERYQFQLIGFVVMPEHVHLLLTEPAQAPLSKAIQALKPSISRREGWPQPFCYPRYYDGNIRSDEKRIEKLDYMAFNPVKRGLCPDSASWPWSSASASPVAAYPVPRVSTS